MVASRTDASESISVTFSRDVRDNSNMTGLTSRLVKATIRIAASYAREQPLLRGGKDSDHAGTEEHRQIDEQVQVSWMQTVFEEVIGGKVVAQEVDRRDERKAVEKARR